MKNHDDHVKELVRTHESRGQRQKLDARYGLIAPKVEHVTRDGNTLRVLVNKQ